MSTLPPSRFNPWPVGLIAFFVLFGSAIAGFIVFSTQHQTDLVTPDYYAQELQYQKQVDRLNRTRAAHLAVAVTLAEDGRQLTVALPTAQAVAAVTGEIHLYRPSAAAMDRRFPLTIDEQGRQALDVAGLAPGLWRVRVRWSFGGTEFYDEQPVVLRRPRAETKRTPSGATTK